MDEIQSMGGRCLLWFDLSLSPSSNVCNQSYAVNKRNVIKFYMLLKKSLVE